MALPTPSRILFPTDFSTCAEGAFRHAAFLADRFDAELHVLHVVEDEDVPERDWPTPDAPDRFRITAADVCRDLRLPLPETDGPADGAEALLRTVGLIETETVGRDAGAAIVAYAVDEEIDLVVMGTHGHRRWQRGTLGSVAEAVTRHAPCPVLTVRPLDGSGDRPWPPSRVLLALDAPDDARPSPAARWAARLAVAYRLSLDVVHVVDLGRCVLDRSTVAQDRTRARAHLLALADRLRQQADAPLPVSVTVRTGDPAEAVLAVAEEGPTHLVVVGTHGRSGPGRVVLGSVAEALMRSASCPVLVARDALADAHDEAPGGALATRAERS